MSKLRKKFITALAVLIFSLLVLSTVLLIPKKNAEAYNAPQTATVDELYIGGTNKFSAVNLRKLYNALDTGAKSLEDVKNDLTITTRGSAVAGKNIIVEFGGMKWLAVYLSKATTTNASVGGTSASATAGTKGIADNEDIVLTLWLAYSTSTGSWQNINSTPANSSTANSTYPANMYGTSYIRSVILNNGGNYWASVSSISNTFTPTSNSSWGYSRFTSIEATNNVVDYLVAPRFIDWQYNQSGASYSGTGKNLNNDSWGTMGSSTFTASYCYEGKTRYDAWKDDLVWLPSLTEVGGNGTAGMWKTTADQRPSPSATTWLRSAYLNLTHSPYILKPDGSIDFTTVNFARIVRPAIHLNLTKASDAAKGVSFDNVKPENVDDGVQFTAGEIDHTFTHVFDGKEVKVTLNEALDGKKMTITGSNYAQGIFSAQYPYEGEDRTYEVTATLQGDYVWDDIEDTSKNKDQRKYKITIKRAEIEIDGGWNRLDVAYGASLLGQDTSKIKSPKLAEGTDFKPKVEYIIVAPNGAFDENSPPSDADDWQESPTNSTATETGTYHVWYRISAEYHNNKIGFYEVKVSQGSLIIEADETEITGEYGQFNGSFNPKDQDWLKEQFADKVTIKGSKTYDNSDDVLKFLKEQKIVVYMFNDDGEIKENKYERYDAGTYYLGLKDDSGSFSFVWKDNKYPVVKITKPTVQVEIIGKEGAELKSIYGNEPVELEYSVKSGLLENEKPEDLNLRYDSFKLDDGSSLTKTTPANIYNITGAARGSNYEINFLKSEYTVSPRPIKLQVADETVEYGKVLSHPFKELTVAEGDLVGSDAVPAVTRYYLLYDSGEMELSSTLAVGKHSLCAEATSTNYEILEIIAGTLTITKANFDMSGVKFENKGYVYDGDSHPAQISGVPEEVSVSFRYVNIADGSESSDPPVEIGLYLAYATFTHTNENYNEITGRVAYIRIAATQEEADKPFPAPPTQEEIEAAAQLAKKKAEAKKSLDEVAKAKKEEIAAMEIDDEEKEKAYSDIDKELAAGNAAIDSATDASGVEQAFNEGKKKIEDISAACKAAEERAKQEAEAKAELERKKQAAKDELEKAAKDKNEAIDNSEMTDEEKAEAKKKVESELAKGKAEIDGATSADGVDSAKNTSTSKINGISTEPKKHSSFPWWIIAVAVGLLLVVAVVIIVIKKRQTADGDDEYDDYYDDDYDFDEEAYEEDFGDDYDF